MAGLFGDYNADTIDSAYGVPDGERDLIISDANIVTSSKGNTGLEVTFTDEETKETLVRWTNLPNTGDPTRDSNNAKWLKRFYESLEIPESQMNTVEKEDLIGIQVTATVFTEEKGQYTNKRMRNVHRRMGSGMSQSIGQATGQPYVPAQNDDFKDEIPF